jgi:tetratricopeptide (TPR) repeat protein
MRLLLYGLQNSGATLAALFAGQREGSLVVPDLWTMYCAPRPPFSGDICIKATVTEAFPLSKHRRAFRPDITALVVRRPIDNYLSLQRKAFANHDGMLMHKFRRVERAFRAASTFDEVVVFEDFVAASDAFAGRLRQLGWSLPSGAPEFPRSALDMEQLLWRQERRLYSQIQWGAGQARIQPLAGIRLGRSQDEAARAFCHRHCPVLQDFYDERDQSHTDVPLLRHPQDEPALQAQQNYAANLLTLFEGYLRIGDTRAAMDVARDLCACAPDVSASWGAKARALEALGQPDDAGSTLESAIANAASRPVAQRELRLHLAQHALRRGYFASATGMGQALLEETPDDAGAHLVIAEASLRCRQFEVVYQHAHAAMTLDPRNVNARRLLAESLLGMSQREEAIDYLRSCLAIAPGYAPAEARLLQLQAADCTKV